MLLATDYDVWFLLLLSILDGDRALFRHNHRFYNALQGGMVVVPFFLEVCDVLLGILRALSDLSSPDKGAGNLNLFTSRSSLIVTTSLAFKKRLFKCWLLNFASLVLFFLTMKMLEDRLSAFIGTFHLKRLFVTHSITCHGRDHLVNIQSERHSLVILNVHFEPDLTSRQLRGRLGLIHPHWLAYPKNVGVILGDFKSVTLKKDDSMFGTKHSPIANSCVPCFPHVLEIAQSDYTRRDSTAIGDIRTLSRIDRIFINLPMAEARDFHCSSHVVENLVKRTIPSDHAAVRLVILKPTHRRDQNKRPNIQCLVLSCSNFMTTTDFLLTRFVRWLNSNFSYIRLER